METKQTIKAKDIIDNELDSIAKIISEIAKKTEEEFIICPKEIEGIKSSINNIDEIKSKSNLFEKIKIGRYVKEKTAESLSNEFKRLNRSEKKRMLQIIDLTATL